jgi:GNAT superfamily N-acetyltransferase
MTQPYNALYGPPQAPVDNALYYDDTQGMPRQRPADPLRWLADAVGQNKDLPAPQFFMDPRALSARNMLHSALNTSANWLDGTRDTSRIGPEEVISPLGLGFGVSAASSAKNVMQKVAKTPERIAADYGATAARYPSERLDNFEIRRTADSKAGGIKYELFEGDKPMGNLLIDAPRHLQPNPMDAVIDHAGGASFKKIERRQPIAGTVTRIEVDDSLKGKGYGSKLLDVAEGDLKRAGAILHPGDTSMTQDFMNLYAKRDPKMMKDALRRMDLGPNDDPSLMFDRAMTYRQRRDQGGSAMADNAKGSAPGTVINSFADDGAKRIGAIERLQRNSHGEEQQALSGLLGKLRAGETPPLQLRLGDTSAAILESKAPLAQRAFGTTRSYNITADGATLGEFTVTTAPRGGKAYVESIHLSDDLKSYAGPGMLRELRSLFHDEFPNVTTFYGDRSTGAHAKSGKPRQEVRWLSKGTDPETGKAIFADNAAASAPGLAANSTQQDDQGVMSILRRYGLAD